MKQSLTVFISLLLLMNISYAMEKILPFISITQEDDDYILNNNISDHTNCYDLMTGIYNDYFYSLIETRTSDDTAQSIFVQRSLFVQLFVQASRDYMIDRTPFEELLQKIKSGVINKNDNMIMLTQKDCDHRLLSYIPRAGIHALVNGKTMWILFEIKMKQIMQTKKQYARSGFGMLTDNFFGYYDLEPTGQKEMMASYDFETNPEHNAAIVAEFEELINS